MLYEYIILFVYLLLALAIAILVVALSFFLVYQNSIWKKLRRMSVDLIHLEIQGSF